MTCLLMLMSKMPLQMTCFIDEDEQFVNTDNSFVDIDELVVDTDDSFADVDEP